MRVRDAQDLVTIDRTTGGDGFIGGDADEHGGGGVPDIGPRAQRIDAGIRGEEVVEDDGICPAVAALVFIDVRLARDVEHRKYNESADRPGGVAALAFTSLQNVRAVADVQFDAPL